MTSIKSSALDFRLTASFELSRDVILRLNSANITWAFFAGIAANIYGVNRKINDIDIIFSFDQKNIVRDAFPEFRLIEKSDESFTLSKGSIELVLGHLVLFPSTNKQESYRFLFDNNMIAKRQEFMWDNIPLYFLSVEDTVVLKAILQREVEDIRFDIDDIVTILSKHTQFLDFDYINDRINKCNANKRVAPVLNILKDKKLLSKKFLLSESK